MEIWASLSWKSPEDILQDSLLPVFPEKIMSTLEPSLEFEKATRLVTGELRALSDQDLTSALNLVLRAITSKAALTEAVLEIRTVRLASSLVVSAPLICEMARELCNAGFCVTFGPTWEPVQDADLVLGTAGAKSILKEFIEETTPWEMAPRYP